MVRLLHFKQNATEVLVNGEEIKEIVVAYVALELASNGMIYDFVERQRFSSEISR